MISKLDVEYCGVNLNNSRLTFIHGQMQMVILMLFVQFMNFIVVSMKPSLFNHRAVSFLQ